MKYLHHTDHQPARIRKIVLQKIEYFKDIKFRDTHKTENCIGISVAHENKQKYPIYVSRNTLKKHVDL